MPMKCNKCAKWTLLRMRDTGLIIRSDLYEMHLPLFETHTLGAAVIADMDSTQLALDDSPPNKRLACSICFCMDRPRTVGRFSSVA